MFTTSPIHRTLSTAAALAAFAGTLAVAGPASAYTCSASAVRGTVLTQTGLEPVVADGGSTCETREVSLDRLPAPLAGTATATTGLSAGQAGALSGLKGFSVGALRDVPVSLPEAQIPDGLDAIRVALPTTAGPLGLPTGLPAAITVDALPAARALVPARQLPDLPLAAVDSVFSAVRARCVADLPDLLGASSVEGLRGLGESLPTAEPARRVVTLLGEQTIPLTGIDPADVRLPAGLSLDDPLTGSLLRSAIDQAIDGLAPIVLPAAVGTVETAPAEQSTGDGALEQRAMRMTVTMAGRQVADLVMGIARVALDGVSCAKAAAAPVVKASEEKVTQVAPAFSPKLVEPASQLAVSCAQASITLVNVIDKDRHVTLIGAADKQLIGKRVRIVQTWNGKRVATTKVGRSGFFRVKAPMPRESVRYTNRARYMAVAGDEKSMPLKLHRRMRFSSLESHGRKVTLKGRVFGPHTGEAIVIRRSVSCTKDVVVKRIQPRRDGSWKVTLKAPKGIKAATYRATTSVRNPGSARMFPTFTLPGYVSL